jgi:hypothetical protein
MSSASKLYPVSPTSVYVWRGFQSTKMSPGQFAEFLASVFVPACALLQPPVGLRAYLPTMVPQIGKPQGVPDQTALMFWSTPQSHDLAARAIAVRIYQNLHGDVYDMTRSKLPEVPVAFSGLAGSLTAEQPYALFDQAADWMHGTVYHLVGARRQGDAPDALLRRGFDWASQLRGRASAGADGALICCGEEYIAAWVHSPTPKDARLKSVFDSLTKSLTPVLCAESQPIVLSAELWDDWSGLGLRINGALNLQFDRPPAKRAMPRRQR